MAVSHLENDEARRKHKIPTQLRFYSLTSLRTYLIRHGIKTQFMKLYHF